MPRCQDSCVSLHLAVCPSLLICCLSTGQNPNPVKGLWALLPKGRSLLCLSRRDQSRTASLSYRFYVCCGWGSGRGERERKTASCWEASQCPLKREIEKKKSNTDEGDMRARARTPVHTPAFTMAVFLPHNQQASTVVSHVSASVCAMLPTAGLACVLQCSQSFV